MEEDGVVVGRRRGWMAFSEFSTRNEKRRDFAQNSSSIISYDRQEFPFSGGGGTLEFRRN